jgi:pilus assembly protein Flp/PilA
MHLVGRFVRDERAATAIEYGLICSLLFLAIVGAINTFASSTDTMYAKISSNMK